MVARFTRLFGCSVRQQQTLTDFIVPILIALLLMQFVRALATSSKKMAFYTGVLWRDERDRV